MADGSITIKTNVDQSGFKSGYNSISKGLGSLTSSIKKFAGVVGVAFSVGAIVKFGSTAVQTATQMSNALTGLTSIMEGQGRSFAQAQDFIEAYTRDGLIPATNAITAYKNLALRGYDDSQIQQVMQALKDSSAYGRQASLTMGEAVQSASEGLKNQNSILVDNAGVTKNVNAMWADYAKSIGVGVNSLTKQQQIQAEVNGILEETKFQTGDAAKVAGTFSGQLLQLQFRFTDFKIAVGNALIPMAKAVLPSLTMIITALTKVANLTAQVSTALFGQQIKQQENIANTAKDAAKAQNEMADATAAAAKEAEGALSGFDELNVLQSETAAPAEALTDTGTGTDSLGNQEIGQDIEVSPQMQAVADRIKEIFEPVKIMFKDFAAGLDLSKAQESLRGLGDALAPIGKSLGEGLFWIFNEVLLPLSAWAINDLLPKYLDTLASYLSAIGTVIDTVKPGFIGLIETVLKPIAEWTGGLILEVLGLLQEKFQQVSDVFTKRGPEIQNILAAIGQYFEIWWAFIKPILNNLKKLLIDVFGATFDYIISYIDNFILVCSGWIDFIKGVFTGDWDKAWGGIKKIFEATLNNIKATATFVWDIIKAIFEAAARNIMRPFDAVKEFFPGVWEGIKKAFSGVGNWFKDTFKKAWQGVKDVFSAGGKIFSGVKEGIADVFKTVVNALITGINVIIAAPFKTINGMLNTIRDISILGAKPFSKLWGKDPLLVPQIPKLARGGIVDAPTLAMVGERGKEAVLPLERNTAWMETLADFIVGRMNATLIPALASAGGGGDIYLDIHIGNEAIDDRFIRVQRRNDIRSNGRS